MNYLADITSLSGDNLGGLLDLQVARAADIQSIPDPVDCVVYGDIDFKPGKGFYTWRATRGTPKFTSQGDNTDEGPVKKNFLDFILPKDDSTIRRQIELAEKDELIVVYRDSNGLTKIFGTLDLPVYFSFSHESGDQVSTRNEYQCRFYSQGPDNCFFYEGDIEVAPGGTPPAVVKRGDGTVIAQLAPGQTLTLTGGFRIGFRID